MEREEESSEYVPLCEYDRSWWCWWTRLLSSSKQREVPGEQGSICGWSQRLLRCAWLKGNLKKKKQRIRQKIFTHKKLSSSLYWYIYIMYHNHYHHHSASITLHPCHTRSNNSGSNIRVIGGLTHVDVIIWMNWLLASKLTSQDLNSSIGKNLNNNLNK